VDVDGNIYSIIQVGNYLWTGENMRIKHDNEGNDLNFFEIEKPYQDDKPYGCLYSWHTAMDSAETESSQGICPEGWHIPTDAEWDSLTAWAGGIDSAGINLMRMGDGKFGATLSGNYNPIQKIHSYFGEEAYFWSSSSFSHYTAWMRNIGKPKKNINRSTVKKHYGFSVRCVRRIH
jgi:uncharacterized protein (TIGR02145 family)